jgi:hypothetical protein
MRERARRAAAVFKAFTLRIPEGFELGVDVEALVGRGDSGDLGEDLSDLTGSWLTDGYPYFLQEYGKHVWNVAAGPEITPADVDRAYDFVQLELDESFFQVRIGRASQIEVAYLSAMADLGQGPYRSGEIAEKLGRTGSAGTAPTRARLIEEGLIYSPSYGLVEFAVPHFQEFIQRRFPL